MLSSPQTPLPAGAVLPLLRKLFDTVLSRAAASGRSGKGMPRVVRSVLPDGRVAVGLSLQPRDAENFLMAVEH